MTRMGRSFRRRHSQHAFQPDALLQAGIDAGVGITHRLGGGRHRRGTALNDYGKLYTVEPTNECHAKASGYVKRTGLEKQVTCIKGFSYEEAVRKQLAQAAPFEIIYVDACHDFDAVFAEIQYFSTILHDDGLMIFMIRRCTLSRMTPRTKGACRREIVEACGRAPELVPIFFEWPYWLNDCGAAMVCEQMIVNGEAFRISDRIRKTSWTWARRARPVAGEVVGASAGTVLAA